MVEPRIFTAPKAAHTLGPHACELAAHAGLNLDEQQAFVLEHALGVSDDGRWAAFEVGVNEPRQNGKGAILEALALFDLYGAWWLRRQTSRPDWMEAALAFLDAPLYTIWSAHMVDTSLEAFHRLLGLIEDTPALMGQIPTGRGADGGIRYSNGSEGITLRNGKRIRFRTRSKSAGRGFSCDRLILDEAMFLAEFSLGAMLPTLRARPNPQLVYTGSAVDQEIHDQGMVWARVRQRGIDGDADLAYMEWSADAARPQELTDRMASDEAQWFRANPALGTRISIEHIRKEFASLDPRTFAVEILGVGDYPDPSGDVSGVISGEEWTSIEDDDSQLEDPVCLAFDVSPDRRASISAAGRRPDGLWHLELVDNRTGTGWVVDRLARYIERHEPAVVVCDGYGPVASLVQRAVDEGLPVVTVTGGEYAQACGRLVDAVTEKTLRVRGCPELTAAVRGAATRPLGDAFAWSRKRSGVDISPLVSGTLALSAAMDQQYDGEVVIW